MEDDRKVILHVYDVTNSANVRTNSVIVNLNKIMRGGIGLGGIFHGAVEVYGKEWSFGFCENGSGVFSCSPKKNPMYTYRESIPLGKTVMAKADVQKVLRDISREWPGNRYDLLKRNCNHFCDALCCKIGAQKLPLWVNRFANAGDAAIEVAEKTMEGLRQAKVEVMSVTKNAMRFMFGSGSPSSESPNSNSGRRSSFNTGSSSRFFSRNSSSSSQNGDGGRLSRLSSNSTEQECALSPSSFDSPSDSPRRSLDSSSHKLLQ